MRYLLTILALSLFALGCAPLQPIQSPQNASVPMVQAVAIAPAIEQAPVAVAHVPPAWFTTPLNSPDTLYASAVAVSQDYSWAINLAQTQAQAELSKSVSDSISVDDQRVLQMQRTNSGFNGEMSRMAVHIISQNVFTHSRRLKTETFYVNGEWIAYSMYCLPFKRQSPFGDSNNIFNSNE